MCIDKNQNHRFNASQNKTAAHLDWDALCLHGTANVYISSMPGYRQSSLDADQDYFPLSPADCAVCVLLAGVEVAVCVSILTE